MLPLFLKMDDAVLDFAKYLGLDGIDADLFYESYYDLDNEEYEFLMDEYYESAS